MISKFLILDLDHEIPGVKGAGEITKYGLDESGQPAIWIETDPDGDEKTIHTFVRPSDVPFEGTAGATPVGDFEVGGRTFTVYVEVT